MRRIGFGVGTSIAVLLVVVGLASASVSFPTAKCGSFKTRLYKIEVLHRNVGCKTATGIIKTFWTKPRDVKQHGGNSDADQYWTVKGYSGWRCYQGAGAGDCISHKKVAGYTAKNR
jgi:hypothetical protein